MAARRCDLMADGWGTAPPKWLREEPKLTALSPEAATPSVDSPGSLKKTTANPPHLRPAPA